MLTKTLKFFAYCKVAILLGACQSAVQLQQTEVANNSLNRSDAVITLPNTQIIDDVLSALVAKGSVAGASALIYHNNKEVYFGAFGKADLESNTNFNRTTLANIYSMTKPVTGTVLMSLYEEGLFDLQAPLAQYLPEYTNMKVYDGENADGSARLVMPNRAIKVIDIFRHTACFGYGWEGTPPAQMMNELQPLDPSKPLSQFSKELATLPLFCHPGEQWKYGVAADVQARLAEVVSGKPFDELVNERVLKPLELKETSYFVPASQKARLAAVYSPSSNGTLKRNPNETVYGFSTTPPVQINGGHGLISTLDDYMRFALMLQNEGTIDDVQILKPSTVALMTKDHLPEGITEREFLPSKGQMGFGLNVAVRIAPPINDEENYGGVGEFLWDGAASTLFWVDPKNDVTAVLFMQVMPFDNAAHKAFRDAVYESLGLLNR